MPPWCVPTGSSPGRAFRGCAGRRPSWSSASSRAAISTIPWRPSRRCRIFPATRWWPRSSPSGPRPTGSKSGNAPCSTRGCPAAPVGSTRRARRASAGDLNLCWSFTDGALGPGVHVGVANDAPGGWADLMAAHDSMLIPIPDSVSDEVAVLADPFSVSLHAILRCPPPPGGRASGLRRGRPRGDQRRHPPFPVPGDGDRRHRPVPRSGEAGFHLRCHPGTAARAPARSDRVTGRVVGRGPPHGLRRTADGPSRRDPCRLRHRGPTGDARARGAGAGGAGNTGADRGAHARDGGSTRPSTSKSSPWSVRTHSGSRRSAASVSTPSVTTSTSCRRARST